MFEWKDSYAVHVDDIDAQHKILFRLAADPHAAMITGQGKTTMARTLDRLIDYTRGHFAHEGKLMQQCQYPDMAAHKTEHDSLTREVLRFQEEFLTGCAILTVQVMNSLKTWLENHIAVSDAKLAPYVNRAAA